MNHTEFKNRVDGLMDLLWGSGVANHSTIIEQINYLVFLRSLTKKDDEAIKVDDESKALLKGPLSAYRWDNLLMLNAEALFNTLEELYKKLPELAKDSTIQMLYRDAHVKIYDKPTLRRLVHEIEQMMSELEKEASHGHKDIFGDMYEYLLGKLQQAGTLGSFRTPRHIIKFMVDVVDPSKGETILDPACGTAGFLVAALEHLKHKYTSKDYIKQGMFPMDKIDPKERKFIFQHALTGFDSDFDMFKFGLMNLYLHQLEHPQIKRLNTLVDTAGDRTKWDIVLANPPFAGALDQDSISEDIRMGTRATEILFLRYMIDHLSPNGRAGVIVPEGVIFSSSNAHKKIRQMLLEDAGLWCVVSLPAGVFNPYAGVKTSIVFFDKTTLKKSKEVLFVKVENDGFDLGATKRPIDKNDLPEALEIINKWKLDNKLESPLAVYVGKEKIAENGDYSLSIDRYRLAKEYSNAKWPMVKLEEVCEIESGSRQKGGAVDNGVYSIGGEQISSNNSIRFEKMKYITEAHFAEMKKGILCKDDVLMVKDGATTGKIGFWSFDYKAAVNEHVFILRAKKELIEPKLLFNLFKSERFQENLQPFIKGIIGGVSLEIKQLQIPLPPLEIQKQIVEVLDDYQNIINGARQVVKSWKPRIDIDPKWEMVKLGEVCDEIMDGTHFSPKNMETGDRLYITAKNIKENGIDLSNISYVSEKDHKEIFNKCPVAYGDVLFIKDGATAGIATINTISEEFSLLSSVAVIRGNKSKLDNSFLCFYLNSPFGRERILSNIGGVAITRLTLNKINEATIPLPPTEIQKQIVEKLEAERALVESNKKLIEIYEQKIKDKLVEVWGEK